MLTLEESKLYLRVDSDDEDVLITSLKENQQKILSLLYITVWTYHCATFSTFLKKKNFPPQFSC